MQARIHSKTSVLVIVAALLIMAPVTGNARQSTQAAFSPSPSAIKLVEKTIRSAEDTVELAAYSFTSKKVAEELILAHQRGVDVRVVLDKGQGKRRYPALAMVYEAGIPVRINHRYAIMHDKYIIIDRKTVETGSFNFTAGAEKRNAENVIVIKNNLELADLYYENWETLWGEAEEYLPPEPVVKPL